MQPLSIPAWKWDEISMDFIVGLPLMPRKHDSIMVIVDRLTKTLTLSPFTLPIQLSAMQKSILIS
jgi:hypothetical protein